MAIVKADQPVTVRNQDKNRRVRGKVEVEVRGEVWRLVLRRTGLEARQKHARKVERISLVDLVDMCRGQKTMRL